MSANEDALAALPIETVEYIGSRLDFDYQRENCPFGNVKMHPLESLRIQQAHVVGPLYEDEPAYAGYMVRVVDLVEIVEDYYPEGVLAWMVDEKMFCTYDSEHENMVAFPGASWQEIVDNTAHYLSIIFKGGGPEFPYFAPWDYGYKPVDDGDTRLLGIVDLEEDSAK